LIQTERSFQTGAKEVVEVDKMGASFRGGEKNMDSPGEKDVEAGDGALDLGRGEQDPIRVAELGGEKEAALVDKRRSIWRGSGTNDENRTCVFERKKSLPVSSPVNLGLALEKRALLLRAEKRRGIS
jgi:hypothetical protein